MSSSGLAFSLLLFSVTLLLQGVFGVDPLFHICSNAENFTTNGPYESNLNKLTSYLESPPYGFAMGLLGYSKHDQVYGLSSCRGDASVSVCRSCLAQATTELRKSCPNSKGAIIWYDDCLFKYMNTDFFGQIDNQNKFSLVNVNYASDPTAFDQKMRELLSRLAIDASSNWKLYAAGESKMDESVTIYGLAQCTRDLSSMDCKKCLDTAISQLPSDGRRGARVVTGSCNVGYEVYPFTHA